MPPPNGREGPIRDLADMYGHGTARSEKVCPHFPQGKAESCSPHSLALHPNDSNDAGGADGAETLRGGVVADGSG